jgi:hypothetical protein
VDPAVATALRDLVADGTLTDTQAARVAVRLAAPRESLRPGSMHVPARGGRLAEMAGYLGGALVLGAAALFLDGGWAQLGEAARALILAGLAAALLVAGGLVARASGQPLHRLGGPEDSARRRLVSVLWTFGAASAAGGAGLAADSWELVAAGTVGVLVGAVTYALVPGVAGQLGAWVGSIALATGLVAEIGDEPHTGYYAVTLVALGATWAVLTLTGAVRARELGFATGAAVALFGAQLPVFAGDGATLAYLLTGAVAVTGFAGYLATRSWAVLGAGVLATTLVVPEALHDWSDGSVSAAGSLLVAGLTLVAASAAGLRLRPEVTPAGTRAVPRA